jgi:hypothetical protein
LDNRARCTPFFMKAWKFGWRMCSVEMSVSFTCLFLS